MNYNNCLICNSSLKLKGTGADRRLCCYSENNHEFSIFLQNDDSFKKYEIDLFGPSTKGTDFSLTVYFENRLTKIKISYWNEWFEEKPLKISQEQESWGEKQWLDFIKNYRLL